MDEIVSRLPDDLDLDGIAEEKRRAATEFERLWHDIEASRGDLTDDQLVEHLPSLFGRVAANMEPSCNLPEDRELCLNVVGTYMRHPDVTIQHHLDAYHRFYYRALYDILDTFREVNACLNSGDTGNKLIHAEAHQAPTNQARHDDTAIVSPSVACMSASHDSLFGDYEAPDEAQQEVCMATPSHESLMNRRHSWPAPPPAPRHLQMAQDTTKQHPATDAAQTSRAKKPQRNKFHFKNMIGSVGARCRLSNPVVRVATYEQMVDATFGANQNSPVDGMENMSSRGGRPLSMHDCLREGMTYGHFLYMDVDVTVTTDNDRDTDAILALSKDDGDGGGGDDDMGGIHMRRSDPQGEPMIEGELDTRPCSCTLKRTYKDIYMGIVPVMARSRPCEVCDDDSDIDEGLGGYFIINGAKKVFVMQEQAPRNRLRVMRNSKTGEIEASIICTYPNATGAFNPHRFFFGSTSWTRRGSRFDVTSPAARERSQAQRRVLMIRYRGLTKPVPLRHVMGALGCEDDEHMLDMCVRAEPDATRRSRLREEVAAMLGPPLRTREGRTSTCTYMDALYNAASPSPGDIVGFYLLPFLGDDLELKLETLYVYVYRLACARLNIDEGRDDGSGGGGIDERDSYANKAAVAEDYYLSLVLYMWTVEVQNHMKRRLGIFSNGRMKGSILGSSPAVLMSGLDSVTNFFTSAIASGKFPKEVASGISQTLDDQSSISRLSDLRRSMLNMETKGKVIEPRHVHRTGWMRICAPTTSEGKMCGMIHHLSMMATISEASDPQIVVAYVKRMYDLVEGAVDDVQDDSAADETTAHGRPCYMLTINGACRMYSREVDLMDPELLCAWIRRGRRAGHLHPHVSVSYNRRRGLVDIRTEAGRYIRAAFLASFVTDRDRFAISCRSYTWPQLLQSNAVEYLDPQEEEECVVASYPRQIYHTSDPYPRRRYTHCEIHPSTQYSVTASLVPNSQMDAPVRLAFSTNMFRQAMQGTPADQRKKYATNHHCLYYAQRAIVSTLYHRLLGLEANPLGQTVSVHVLTAGGENVEDAIVLNDDSAMRGRFMSLLYKMFTERENCANDRQNSQTRSTFRCPVKPSGAPVKSDANIEADGLPQVGTFIRRKGIIIGKVQAVEGAGQQAHTDDDAEANEGNDQDGQQRPQKKRTRRTAARSGTRPGARNRKLFSSQQGVSERTPAADGDEAAGDAADDETAEEDSDVSLRLKDLGKMLVDDAFIYSHDLVNNLRTARVQLVANMKPVVSDKLTSLHGQKGLLKRLRAHEMPFDPATGIPADIIINPHGYSRITEGQTWELVMSLMACATMEPYDATAFESHDLRALLADVAREARRNSDLTVRLMNPETGRHMETMSYSGFLQYLRLKHLVELKVHARDDGPLANVTRTPVKGRKNDGGQKFGEMEKDCIDGYGAASIAKRNIQNQVDQVSIACPHCVNVEGLSPMERHADRSALRRSDPGAAPAQAAVADEQHSTHWCNICKRAVRPIPIEVPFVFLLASREAMAAGIKVEKKLNAR